jgi:UDPglucose 6-dehydrogenase
MRVAMVGSGYVGLVSGACFADFGHQVTCIDSDGARIEALRRLEIPIYEPGLNELIAKNVREKRLAFTTDLATAVGAADVVFIAVGTPSRRGDGFADLTHVYEATRQVTPALRDSTVLAVKSTVPVGTGDEVERIVREIDPKADASVASNPEFLREGAAIGDFKRPDRVVIGVEDERAEHVLSELYRPLNLNQVPLLITNRRTAELVKYAANAFLSMKITYINELADLCEQVGINVQDVARGIGLDNRIGTKFLHAGPGFGGSCLPKDAVALMKTAQDAGTPLRLLETTIAVNDMRKRTISRKVMGALGGSVRGTRIAVLGVTFKPNTDDIRDAPALSIIQALQDGGARIAAYDPEGMPSAKAVAKDVDWAADPYDCAAGADALVIVTEWDAFRALDFGRLKTLMKRLVLVDLRNIYRKHELAEHGFRYISVGRPEEDGPVASNEAAE